MRAAVKTTVLPFDLFSAAVFLEGDDVSRDALSKELREALRKADTVLELAMSNDHRSPADDAGNRDLSVLDASRNSFFLGFALAYRMFTSDEAVRR